MTNRRCTLLAAAVFLGLVGAASPAAAAQPVFERITVDETFEDEFLTEECGVPVTTTVSGTVIIRTFEDSGTGPLEVSTISISARIQSGDNRILIRDVGADLLRRTPDGTLILTITGQVPFEFKGALKTNETTGEVILEPKPSKDLERVCAALTR